MINKILEKLNEEKFVFRDIIWDGGPWQKNWTYQLKKLLCDLGETLMYDTATNGLGNRSEGEFLFDLIWYTMSAENTKVMSSIPLVLESEISKMNFGGFKVDFEKLLVASNSERVFVTIQKKQISQEWAEKIEFAKETVRLMEGINNVHIIYWQEWNIKDDNSAHFVLETITG